MIYRKISGRSRSEGRAEIYARVYSVYCTSKLTEKNFVEDTPSIIKRMTKHEGQDLRFRLASHKTAQTILEYST
ncbi:MAG: hypothetical protein ACP5OC_08180 [Thermoplasmata archaeon]